MKARIADRWLALVSPLGLLLLWEGLSRAGLLDVRFITPPSAIGRTLVALTRTGELPYHVGVSVERIIAGFLLGSIPAVALGLAMGLSRSVRALLMPIVAAIYPIPKIAIYPLIIFYLGIGEASKVSIVALSIFFLVLLNTMAGVLGMDRTYFNIARAYGARSIDVFTTIAWPGALPSIFTGLKLGMGFAMIGCRNRFSHLAIVPDLRDRCDVRRPAGHRGAGMAGDDHPGLAGAPRHAVADGA
ncbi:MAG: ABC transporter permease [Bacillati bacterium ANGP1]|uniref:ABC transporter permease n=1 Tax=Candidatus Segetimicrobium genomatis TaxID=2569760 RepID=A0A537LFT5_9BACT|nr:MAG: ABC transporter permease [Terrabacteria group bacterium ANGP1]